MPLTALPRTLVNAGFNAARLPLNALERMTGQAAGSSWPPALMFESFEAGTKRLLGTLLRDEELTREGTLQRAKVAELSEAERLEALAEQKRLEADAQLEQERQRAEEARTRIAEQEREHQRQLAQERLEDERQIREATRKQEAAAANVAAAREKSVVAQEREAQKTRIAEESAALAQKSVALDAKRKAQAVDQALTAKKAQRKATS